MGLGALSRKEFVVMEISQNQNAELYGEKGLKLVPEYKLNQLIRWKINKQDELYINSFCILTGQRARNCVDAKPSPGYEDTVDGKVKRSAVRILIEAVKENPLTRYGKLGVENIGRLFYTENKNSFPKDVQNVSRDLISLDLAGANYKVSKDKWSNRLEDVLKHKHVVCVSNNSTIELFCPIGDGNSYINLNCPVALPVEDGAVKTREQVLGLIEKSKSGKTDFKVDVYWAFVNNPSRQRNKTVLLIRGKESKNPLSYPTRWIHKLISLISNESFDVVKASHANKAINFSKAFKEMSRMSLPMTGSKEIAVITSVAWFHGEFSKDGVPIFDGAGFLNSAIFKGVVGYDDTRIEELAGSIQQGRSIGTMKGAHMVVLPMMMGYTIQKAAEVFNIEIVYVEETSDLQYWAEVQNGKYDGKITVHGTKNLDDVSFFGDDTVIKTASNLGNLPCAYNAMATPKNFKKNATTSIQVASSFFGIEGFEDVFRSIAMDNIKKILEPKKGVEYRDVRDVKYPLNTLISLGKLNLVKEAWIRSVAKELESMINDFKFEVDGIYGLLSPDIGNLYGIKILEDNEIFVNNPALWGLRCVVVRFPHICPGEHVKAKFVGLNVIIRRLNALYKSGKISLTEKWLLLDYYIRIKPGVIVVQSANPRFGKLLGGSDYDGDGVIIYVEKFNDDGTLTYGAMLVKMWDRVAECAIEFGKPAPNTKSVRFNISFLNEGYLAMVQSPNEPVGVLVNRNSSFASMLSLKDSIEESELTRLLLMFAAYRAESFVGKKYERRYDCGDAVIDADAVNAFIEEVDACGVTRENFFDILSDLNKVYSSVIGRNIDSAKSGEIVPSPLKYASSIMDAGMIKFAEIKICKNKETKQQEVKLEPIATGFIDDKLGNTKFIINDPICRLKNELFEYVAKRIEELISLNAEDIYTTDPDPASADDQQ
jgi:hypothetical protein